jgi:hypothetical protein
MSEARAGDIAAGDPRGGHDAYAERVAQMQARKAKKAAHKPNSGEPIT